MYIHYTSYSYVCIQYMQLCSRSIQQYTVAAIVVAIYIMYTILLYYTSASWLAARQYSMYRAVAVANRQQIAAGKYSCGYIVAMCMCICSYNCDRNSRSCCRRSRIIIINTIYLSRDTAILYTIAHTHSIIYGMELNNNHNYTLSYLAKFTLNLIVIALVLQHKLK